MRQINQADRGNVFFPLVSNYCEAIGSEIKLVSNNCKLKSDRLKDQFPNSVLDRRLQCNKVIRFAYSEDASTELTENLYLRGFLFLI